MSRWLRLYTDVLDDPKVQRLPPELFKAWINMLCLAGRNGGRLPSLEDTAFALRVDAEKAKTWCDELVTRALLDLSDGNLRPHNWATRQFVSDGDPTAAERQRRKRERSKASVTDESRVTSHGPEQNRSESEHTEGTAGALAPASCDESVGNGFAAFWTVYPRRQAPEDKEGARKAFITLAATLGHEKLISAAQAYAANCRTRNVVGTRYVKQARTWLNSGTWQEFTKSKDQTVIEGENVFEGTAEWKEWCAHLGKRSLPTTTLRGKDGSILGTGWIFPTKRPPAKPDQSPSLIETIQ